MEFKELQSQLQDLRRVLEAEEKAVFRNREGIKRLDLEKRRIGRSRGVDDAAVRELKKREDRRTASLAASESRLQEARRTHDMLLEAFRPFMDPREHLGQLPDAHPLLLFPVRLETRFRKSDREGAGQHQLLVRVFPDTCSIDTFDDTLSGSEVVRAQNYWRAIWKAGRPAGQPPGEPAGEAVEAFVEDARMGAWRALMGTHNAGRAYWVIQNYRPDNEADMPARSDPSDVLLVISTEDPPAEPVRNALKTYWEAVYAARGDKAQSDAALAALAVEIGGAEETVRDLVETYAPAKPDDDPGEPGSRVEAAFLVFPKETDAKLTAWSQASKVRTFPDRFVLLGYQDDFEEPVIEQLGEPIPNPLIVGPDTRDDIGAVLREAYGEEFDEWTDDEKAVRYVEFLSESSDTRWLFDFDAAVAMGLGFRVDLTADQYAKGFRRLFVVGVKLSTDAEAGRIALEELLRNHQFGDSGVSIIPQGTPSNNTEEAGSGFSERESAEEAFDRYFGNGSPEDPDEARLKRDGRRLAELLGIDADAAELRSVENYFGKDQIEARAMNTALWNATIGFFLESKVTPVTSERDREWIRWFLVEHVRGRGSLPALRIGDEPYGILPISDLRNPGWLGRGAPGAGRDPSGRSAFLSTLYDVLSTMRNDWEHLVERVNHVGKDGDPHKTLLGALGLHAQSVEFDRRIAQSFQQIKNSLYAQGILGDDIDQLDLTYRAAGMALLDRLGYRHDTELDPRIPILDRSFLGSHEDVNKHLVDDTPLSEMDSIRAYTDEGWNYIRWLIENARVNHRNIKDQKGFSENRKPVALLYDMLRHALNLEFGNTGLNLFRNAEILTAREAAAARIDAGFIGIQTAKTVLESKWDIIYRQDDRIAGGELVADRISRILRSGGDDASARQLQEVLEALELLEDAPTARLERCFVEHLDCCSYRLDAWLLGLLHLQLEAMRSGSDAEEGGTRRGVYIGAYGWVENLEPEDRELTPVPLNDELRGIFDPAENDDIVRDDSNAGYVHAPSINHAVTAAVLRNAYISTADEEDAERYKVNLSSERVRLALTMIEGVQQGQSLAALLGYQLERGLHDDEDEELDIFIYELRKVFPLVANRLKATAVAADKVGATAEATLRHAEEAADFEEDRAVTRIEARNVVNGLALLAHVKKSGKASYPFGFPTGDGAGKLKEASAAEKAAIDREVARLMNIRDAVADLAIAESVHQVVQGNFERAAGALDAYSKGGFPHLPDVVQSSGSGVGLTHRFAVHLPTGVSPDAGATPRSKAEPALNRWLAGLLPDPGQVACDVRFRAPSHGEEPDAPWSTVTVTMGDLGLEPIDLLYLQDVESGKNLSALDDYVMEFFQGAAPRRPDLEVAFDYATRSDDRVTFFEVAAMIGALRKVVVAARPLEAADIRLPNEQAGEGSAGSSIDPERIAKAKAMLDDATSALKTDFIDVLAPLIDDEDVEIGMGNSAAILGSIDARAGVFVTLLSRLSLFGLEQAGAGFVLDRRGAISSAIRTKFLALRKDWDERRDRYDHLVDVQLPTATDDEERIRILHEAEARISSTFTSDFTTVAELQTKVGARRDAFDDRYDDIDDFLAHDFFTLFEILDAAAALVAGLESFEVEPPELGPELRQVVILAEDMMKQAEKLHAECVERSQAAQGLLDEEAVSASAEAKTGALTKAAKLLFGEDFQVIPHFLLDEEQGQELQQCRNAQTQLLSFQRNERGSDFPVDDWLYGVARVREKLGAWESVVMLAEGFRDRPPLDLTPFQLPFEEDDSWVALEYPETHAIESDKLLYTAFMDGFDPDEPQCGLLVDEWTEVIPAPTETTGLVFHYDRPNCEAPQSMLLATPSAFRGEWSWQDVVHSLHEALDLAKFRAIEPDLVEIEQTGYSRFLPMTVATMTYYPVTMALNYAATQVAALQHDD
jgi:hypothetical protein